MVKCDVPSHILVAEDDVQAAWALQDILQQAGYRTTVTHDGLQALAVEAMDPADLLLTDLTMPRLDGRSLIRRLRAARPSLPVLVMSGDVNVAAGEVWSGAMAPTLVLVKPTGVPAILRAIRTLLART
ncbi:response regulator [Azospirillum doebereinerae]